GDTLNEADETFLVNLTKPVNAILNNAQGTVTIRNDDTPPQLTINNVIVTEGNSGTTNVLLTVSLSAPSGLPVSVDWATADGTATAGSDYIAANGTLTFGQAQALSVPSTQRTPPTTTGPVVPSLEIRMSGQSVMISASVSLEGFELQARDDLSDNSQWVVVTGE